MQCSVQQFEYIKMNNKQKLSKNPNLGLRVAHFPTNSDVDEIDLKNILRTRFSFIAKKLQNAAQFENETLHSTGQCRVQQLKSIKINFETAITARKDFNLGLHVAHFPTNSDVVEIDLKNKLRTPFSFIANKLQNAPQFENETLHSTVQCSVQQLKYIKIKL